MSEFVIRPQRSFGADRLARFRSSAAFDVLARAPLIAWFLLCGWAASTHLLHRLQAGTHFGLAKILEACAGVVGLGFILLVSGALFIRLQPIARAAGLPARLAALCGTFSITALALFPRADLPLAATIASFVVMCFGYGFACYALVHLGRSLSIMAEARRLVTTGPYRFVRHPLYAGEAAASVGLLMQFLSPAAIVLWVTHMSLQLLRMRYEERLLDRAFPEYAPYAQRVSRLIPGVY